MSKKVSLLIVGAGGYGNNYLRGIFSNIDEKRFTIKGVVDPNPSTCNYLEELKQLNVRLYKSIEEFYAADTADLAVISSPIQFHAQQSCFALEHGSNVLCEKPICSTIQDAIKMVEARDKSGKFLAVGYQWSYEDAMLDFKRDILSGILGRPRRLKTLVLWPRNKTYYNRSIWAGKMKDTRGNWILDSVANNATAHYLHNMFFILGDKLDTSVYPVSLKAELYRANPIENFDTSVIKAFTDDGVEILFYATHAVKDTKGPIFQYEFENGIVSFGGESGQDRIITATFNDGSKKVYGEPYSSEVKKLWKCIDAIAGIKDEITCKLETAIPHLLCINGVQESVLEIESFSDNLIKNDTEKDITWVEGLADVLSKCYENATLPSNEHVEWAKCGKEIDLKNYNYFRGKSAANDKL